MSPRIDDASTGWSFTYEVGPDGKRPTSGLVLTDVQHQGHNFAKGIRLIGLRMVIEEVDASDVVTRRGSEFFSLDGQWFDVSEIVTLAPAAVAHPKPRKGTFQYLKESDEALYLRNYFKAGENHVACGLRCDYRMKELELRNWLSNAEFAGLVVSQTFLFSRYASSPAHEPSGNLAAARCHPMVSFEVIPAAKVDRTKPRYRVQSIRFDYAVHLYLDRHHDLKENALLLQFPHIGNQAGLFRDNENLNTLGLISRGVAGAIFAAVEKPLVLEVTAPGLAMGVSVFDDGSGTPKVCWDNVHWWGARGRGKPMISSPGAFHAAHVHWRWGTVGERIRFSRQPLVDVTGTPGAVTRDPASGDISGALVDPRIWMQSIRVAVTKYEQSLDPTSGTVSLAHLCRQDWKSVFIGLRAEPSDIQDGEDMVLWYSVEAHREVVFPGYKGLSGDDRTAMPTLVPRKSVIAGPRAHKWAGRGTVFLHGIFFAHNAEQDTGPPVGDRGAQHWPNSAATIRKKKSWFRSG